MRFGLFPVEAGELKQYKLDMQEAFQEGFGNKFGKTDEIDNFRACRAFTMKEKAGVKEKIKYVDMPKIL